LSTLGFTARAVLRGGALLTSLSLPPTL